MSIIFRTERSVPQRRPRQITLTPAEYEATNIPVREDEDERDWISTGDERLRPLNEKDRLDSLFKVRWLAKEQPNVIQALRLYRSYVLGRSFSINLLPRDLSEKMTDRQRKIMRAAGEAWDAFLKHNAKWWSIRQAGNRKWRDGDRFDLKVSRDTSGSVPELRFVDPEEIADPTKTSQNGNDSKGIVTQGNDVAAVQFYQRVDPRTQSAVGTIPAADMFHTKIDCDSTEKRGTSRFYPVIYSAKQFDSSLTTEGIHRRLQASIVLQQKVTGSPTRVSSLVNNSRTGTTRYPEGTISRQKIRPGTIITTNHGVEVQFAQPQSNFTDASPLLKWWILQISSATGWPYYAISADSSDTNFASSLVQESPVVLMVEEEQDEAATEFLEIYLWVMNEACRGGLIPGVQTIDAMLDEFLPHFEFPKLVTRDGLKYAQESNIYFMTGGVSRREMSRRAGADPDLMEREIEEDMDSGMMFGATAAAMNQDPATKAGNDPAATGGNQGDPSGTTGHSDKL